MYLGSGQTVVSGFYDVYSFSPSNWNSADVINGGTLILNTNAGASTYDLTGNTLQNIGELIADGDNITLDINSADAAGVSASRSCRRQLLGVFVRSSSHPQFLSKQSD